MVQDERDLSDEPEIRLRNVTAERVGSLMTCLVSHANVKGTVM